MTGREEWRAAVGVKWATEWRRTDRSFTGLTEELLRKALSIPVHNVLDIGCGAGEIALALARSNQQASVTGIDVSADLIEVARARGGNLQNLRFVTGDAQDWSAEGQKADLLISRHGTMFFDDPVAAFGNLRSNAFPHARLIFSCFRERRYNDWATEFADLSPQEAEPVEEAPGPFAFGREERIQRVLSDAGWGDVQCEPIDYAYVAGAGPEAVEDAKSYLLAIGPAAAAAAKLEGSARDRFESGMEALLRKRCEQNIVAFEAAAWIVTARPI